MRPIAAIIIWIIVIGGLYSYMSSRDNVTSSHPVAIETATGKYKLVLTTTFDTTKDPFELKSDTNSGNAVSIELNGLSLLRLKDGPKAGRNVILDDVEGIKIGANEFFLEANPPHNAEGIAGAVRVQLFRSHEELIDKTFWGDPGEKIISTFKIEIAPDSSLREQHDH